MKSGISIIIPTYNRRIDLMKCINSISSQDYPKDKYEIIIIDNNSTDSTIKSIKSINNKNIKILTRKKQSSYAARNKGVKNSKFNILFFTDSDCILQKNTLKDINSYFKDKKVDLAKLNITVQNPNSQLLKFQQNYYDTKKNTSHSFLFETNSLVIRKNTFNQIGTFDESFFSGGDNDYSIRAKAMSINVKMLRDIKIFHKSKRTLSTFLKMNYYTGKGKIVFFNKYRRDWIFDELLSPIHIISIIKDLLLSTIDLFRSHPKRFFSLYFALGNIAYRLGISIELLKNSKFAKAFK